MMSRVQAAHQRMLERKAAAAGCTVAELLARGEREAARQRHIWELRFDRAAQWRAIGRKAAAHGRVWSAVP